MNDNTIQTQELTLIPGFESLGLRVNPQTNKLQIKYKKAVQFDIYKHQSGPHRSALLNLRAVFEYQDGDIYRSIELFEKSCKLDPTNLNALASLEYVYREVGVSKKAAEYGKKLEQLQGNPTCRARCFFEQGYMIAFDVFVEAQGVTGIQAHAYYLKALEMVHRKEADIEHRELLEWCFYVAHNLIHIIKTEAVMHSKSEKNKLHCLALKLFHAVTFTKDDNYKAQAWASIAHLLSSRCIRIVSSSQEVQNHNSKGKKNPQKTELSPRNVSQQQCKSVKSQFSKDPNATATKSNVKSKPLNKQNSKDNIQMKFLEEFCEQVYSNVLGLSAQEHLPEENRAGSGQSSEQATDTDRSKNKRDKQEAQSSAVPKKKNRRQHGHIKVPPGLKELGLVKAPYFENKDELCKCVSGFFEKAKSYAPCYTNILNRYAHFLWHIGKEDEAMEIHEESIDIDKCESNWFAFKSMGENLRKKYKDEWYDRVHQKSDKNPRIELAFKAKEKLEIAVQHNPNPQDYAYLAETCHFLGIDTNRQVTDEKMLLKALYYFKYATNNLQGGRIPMLHHLLGLCLLDLGEKRNALESFKNALQCQEPNSTFTISFRCMMLVLLQICKSAKTKSDDRTYQTAVRELRHWMIEGCHPNRYLEKELLKEISELWGPRKEPFEPDILTEICVKLKNGKQEEQNVSSLLEGGLKLCIDKYPKQPAPTAGSEPAERDDLHVSQLRTCLEKIQLAPTPKAAEPVSMPGAAVDVPEVVMGSSQTSQDVLKEATSTSQSTYRGVDETTLAESQALPQALDPNSVKTSVVQEEGRSLEEKGAGMLPSEMPPNLLPPDSNEDDTYRPASAQSEYTSSSVQVEPLTDIVRTGDPEAQDTFQQERREARNDTLTADKPAKSEEIHEKNDKEIQCDISTEPPSDMMGQVPSSPPLAYCFESKRAKNLKGMEYDFFVMYCDSDADFVSFHLLTTLENSKELKGCIKDRDFMPGQIVLNCVTNAIKNSSKVIAVISHASVKDSDWLYEIYLAIKEYNKRGSLALQSSKLPSSYVIPILCENEAGELPIMPEVFEVFAAAKVPFDRKDCNWDKLEKAIRDDE